MFKFVTTKNSLELFHRAVIHNDVTRVRLILEEAMKDPRFNIDDINEEGLTALQFSCFAGNLDIVKTLVSYGANIRIRDRNGHTVLHAAAMGGYENVVKYLLRTGLKPTIHTDDGLMPIDVAEDISTVVVLLRSMLDQGFLKEMQDYMIDHPKLKRNIFEELEKVKCREREKNEILKELPYTSRTHQRRTKPERFEKLKDHGKLGRSRSTFSELSNSMQHLDKIFPNYDDNNNESAPKEPIYEEVQELSTDVNTTLRRQNSVSSTSSRSSYASHNSTGSGGILRNRLESDLSHENMQRYLESRYPINKSVTFDLHNTENHRSYSDGYISDNLSIHSDYDHLQHERRAYSDGYLSDNYEGADFHQQRRATVTRTSSVSSQSSIRSEQSYRSENSFEDNLYDNACVNSKKQPMPTIVENRYENVPLRGRTSSPPPIPPRIPLYNDEQTSDMFDRQLASETDSGIDINETTGRMFALAFDEQQQQQQQLQQREEVKKGGEELEKLHSYAKPIGLYYSNHSQNVSAKQANDSLPIGSFIIKKNGNINNNKYMSWNGRSHQDMSQYEPYETHQRRQTKDDCDVYKNTSQNNDFLSYNFDHQPDIML